MNDIEVPLVIVKDASLASTALLPLHIADTCARWSIADMKKAKRLLLTTGTVQCLDATAFVAALALSMQLLCDGKEPKANIVKAYEPCGDNQ